MSKRNRSLIETQTIVLLILAGIFIGIPLLIAIVEKVGVVIPVIFFILLMAIIIKFISDIHALTKETDQEKRSKKIHEEANDTSEEQSSSSNNNSYTCVPTKRPSESLNTSKQQKKATSNSNSYTYVPTKQTQNTPKEEKTYQAQAPVTWEVRYKVAEDLPAENVNYRRKPLLTDHERKFYYSLAPIAKKYDLCVLSKIRIADLVEPTAHAYRERSEYFHYFGKIKAKHIDFALCDPADLEVKLLIELDDWTHGTAKGRERDEVVEEVYRDTGYRLLRVYDPWSLEQKIREALDITEEYKIKTP